MPPATRSAAPAGAGNVISGNLSVGVQFLGPGATGNRVQGNLIGTDATGTAAVGNVLDGVFLDDAPGNLIGGRQGEATSSRATGATVCTSMAGDRRATSCRATASDSVPRGSRLYLTGSSACC
jgi:hypothetical protein